MNKVLIYYGFIPDWTHVFDANSLMSSLGQTIKKILIITDIDTLKKYLQSDGLNYKNYIFPIKIENIVELNNAGINSLFEIKTPDLKKFADKKLFVEYVCENKLQKFIPECYFGPRNTNDFVIIKPKISYYSIGIYTKLLKDVKQEEFSNNIVQKYIYDQKEYAGYFVAHNGKITHGFAYLSIYGKDPFIKNKGGKWDGKPQTRVDLDKNVLSVLEKFLIPCSYTGVCSIDFKMSDTYLYVFEINPRLGGSLNDKNNKEDLTDVILSLMKIYDERNVFN